MRENNEIPEILFEVFPILQIRYNHIPDYRFACLLPKSSRDTRMCKLKYPDEGFLLYMQDIRHVIGKDLKQGIKLTMDDRVLSDENVSAIHFHFQIIRVEGTILPLIFDYARSTDQLWEFFELVSLLTKCGLKMQYKRSQKETIDNLTIEVENDVSDTAIMRARTKHYMFDGNKFLANKINNALINNSTAYEFYSCIRELFLSDINTESEFIRQFVAISQLLNEYIELPISYHEN